jgi:predicted dehydrogenase
MRPALSRRAIAAGKHLYCEKPIAVTAAEVIDLARTDRRAGIKHGAVLGKLFPVDSP